MGSVIADMPAAKTNENANSDKFKAKEANCSKNKGSCKMVPAAGVPHRSQRELQGKIYTQYRECQVSTALSKAFLRHWPAVGTCFFTTHATLTYIQHPTSNERNNGLNNNEQQRNKATKK
jgi:hypothetical protein